VSANLIAIHKTVDSGIEGKLNIAVERDSRCKGAFDDGGALVNFSRS